MELNQIKNDIIKLKNPEKIAIYKNFHKTKQGGYADGEEFLGLTVPQIRKLAEKYSNVNLNLIEKLLSSNIHEEKYLAAHILVNKYNLSDEKQKKRIINFYLKNTKKISGWDLVDTTAFQILGSWLLDRDKSILYKLASSDNLWEKRISIISTYAFIKNNEFDDTLKIAEILLKDKHDLIHKAVGWMLREIGNSNIKVEKDFLKKHYKAMPRTMLRYAIERFPEKERKAYIKGKI